MTIFSDLHRGQRVRLYDVDGEDLLPPVFLLLEAARPCEGGRCCEAWAVPSGTYRPYKLHSREDAEVVLVPRQAHPSTPSECAGPADVVAEHGTDEPRPPVPRDPRNPAEDEMTDDDNEFYEQEKRT